MIPFKAVGEPPQWPQHWVEPHPDQAHLAWMDGAYVGIHPSLKQPLRIDFHAGDLARRARQGGEMLAKAVAAAKGLHVVDATAGLGRDAFLMMSAGARVTAIESSPVLGFWLAQNARGTALTVLEGAAQEHLAGLAPDVIYLDPMFPHRQKSAQVGGESQFLQAFAPPPDAIEQAELLTLALATARYRVVVKRPIKAPALADRVPSASIKGKAVRFDLYGIRKLP